MYPQGDLTQPQYMNNVVPQQQFAGPTAMATGDQQLQGPGILSRVKEGITHTVDPVSLCPESRELTLFENLE